MNKNNRFPKWREGGIYSHYFHSHYYFILLNMEQSEHINEALTLVNKEIKYERKGGRVAIHNY